MKQTTDTVLMIEPIHVGLNRGEAENYELEPKIADSKPEQVNDLALLEFRNAVKQLQELGVEVITFKSQADAPDFIFPSIWISTHQSGQVVTYPVSPENGLVERRKDIIVFLEDTYGYREHLALEMFEAQEEPLYLEGTGSLVLDRIHKIAYAAISSRTEEEPLQQFCDIMDYKAISFKAYTLNKEAIYHTSSLMTVGETFAVVGMDAVKDADKLNVQDSLIKTGKEIIEVSEQQLHSFRGGNMLQLENKVGEKILVLSKQAYQTLTEGQLTRLKSHNDHLLPLPVHVIEKLGGGSVGSMMVEIFKPV